MALVTSNEGEVAMLTLIMASNPVLHLYTNNVTPGATDTVATYTEEDDASYAEVTLSSGSWTIEPSGGEGTAPYPQQAISIATTTTIYGYFVTNTAGTTLLWAERFSSPATYGTEGGTVNVNPKFTLQDAAA
jgi:hypothetical protein